MTAATAALSYQDESAPAPAISDFSEQIVRNNLTGRGFGPDSVDWWVNVGKLRFSRAIDTNIRYNAQNDAIVIPYFDLDGLPVIDKNGRPFERVRLLHCDEKAKYRSERGTGLHAYLPPMGSDINPYNKFIKTWRKVFDDPTEMIAITEGEFKAGTATLTDGGIPTIGLGGVDCLTSRKDGLVPELHGLKLDRRDVFIIFDAPIHDGIKNSIKRTAAYLLSRGAIVKTIDIGRTETYKALLAKTGYTPKPAPSPDATESLESQPTKEDCGPKMGLDDYIIAGGKFSDLILVSEEYGKGESNINTLLPDIAIVTGDSAPTYVHINGKHAGVIRKKQGMAETLANKLMPIQRGKSIAMMPMFDDWIQSHNRIELDGIECCPQYPPLSITPHNKWNSWVGFRTVPIRNDALAAIGHQYVDDFFSHEFEKPETITLHRKIFKQHCAHIIQKPHLRHFTSFTFISKHEGIGKSAMVEIIAYIIGLDYGDGRGGGALICGAEELESDYSDNMGGKIYVVFNEPTALSILHRFASI